VLSFQVQIMRWLTSKVASAVDPTCEPALECRGDRAGAGVTLGLKSREDQHRQLCALWEVSRYVRSRCWVTMWRDTGRL
jgi:hypothetical protein